MNIRLLHFSTSPVVKRLLGSWSSLLLLTACSGGGNTADTDTLSAFHADDDIAMVVSSMADAITVGEPFDSAAYSFRGVLTDGTGRPLYTDMHGMPGEWSIDVADSTKAVLRNVHIGDLEADDLRQYIASELQLDTAVAYVARDFKGRRQTVYNIEGGYITMTVKRDTTPHGFIGDRVSIIVRK